MGSRFREKIRHLGRWLGLLVAVIVIVIALSDVWSDKSMSIQEGAMPAITVDDLAKVNRTRVFFAHRSVGENVLGGIPAVYSPHGVAAPPIEQGRPAPGPDGGFIAHEFIGENEYPLGKIEDFDKILRAGMAEQVDVALMKFCYVDFTSGTDVDALFAQYRDTVAALAKDYPEVTFIHTTAPLTTEPRWKTRVKKLLGVGDRFGPAENVVRERFNRLMLREHGNGRLFDLAAIESTAPDGSRISQNHDGERYFALYDGYASDLGHLNQQGSKIAATAFIEAIVGASRT